MMTDLARRLSVTIALTLVLCGSVANADLLGLSRSAAGQAQAVTGFIARNEELRKLSEVNPELARLIATRLMELTVQEGVAPGQDVGSGDSAKPDIDGLIRSSPEAVLDLIELMKKASKAQ